MKRLVGIMLILGGVLTVGVGMAAASKGLSYPVSITLNASGASGFVAQSSQQSKITPSPRSNVPYPSVQMSFWNGSSSFAMSAQLNYLDGIGTCLASPPPNTGYVVIQNSTPVVVYVKPKIYTCQHGGYGYNIPASPGSSKRTVPCKSSDGGYVCSYDPTYKV